MIIAQILYLIINLIGATIGLVWFFNEAEPSCISNFFTFIGKHLGSIILALVAIISLLLFLPALAFMTVVITFIMIYGSYSK